MNTSLYKVIQFLNEHRDLRIELPKVNFDLIKALVYDSEKINPEKVHNCIVLLREYPKITDESFKNCLLIHNYSPFKSENFFEQIVTNPLEIFDTLMKYHYANEPFGIDEMKMVYWENHKNTVERVILGYPSSQVKSSFIIGPGARVGISGDQIYYDKDAIPRQVLSIGGVKIGKNVIIGPNVIIYRGHTSLTEIADNTVIGANSIIHGGCKVKGYIAQNKIIRK